MPTALGTIASQRTVTSVSPIPINGLAGWWDASDVATITASAGAVSQLNDKSGNNRHVVQTVTPEKPMTGIATQNGKNVLVFDGGDILFSTGSTGVNIGNATVFVVGKETVQNDFVGMVVAYSPGQTDYASVTAFPIQTVQGGSGVLSLDRQNQPARIAGSKPTPFAVYSARLTASLVELFQNGVLGTPSATYTDAWGVATGGWVFGGRYLGSLGSGYRLNGQIAEVIAYDRALTIPERQQVEQYLALKWWSPAQLPNLVAWWDSSDASTVINPANVTAWNDKSGQGHHLTPITTNTVQLTSINGKPMVSQHPVSTGATQLRNTSWTRTSVETIIGVFWFNGPRAIDETAYTWTTVSAGDRCVYWYGSSPGEWYSGEITYFQHPGPTKDTRLHLFGACHNGSSSWLDVDGVRATGENYPQIPVGFQVGPYGMTGSAIPEPSMATGELLVVSGTMTPVDLSATYNYLKAKWGTP